MIEQRHRDSLLWVVGAVAVGVVAGGIVLSLIGWMFGLLFHLFAFALRLAVIVGFAALVLWLVRGRRHRSAA